MRTVIGVALVLVSSVAVVLFALLIGFAIWAHHMFTVGLPVGALVYLAMLGAACALSITAGVWLLARRVRLRA